MPLPNWPKLYLPVDVPEATDPDVAAMASLYVRAAGVGMVSFCTKVLPLFRPGKPFGKHSDATGRRWAPLMTDADELAEANTIISDQLASSETTDVFGVPMTALQVVLAGLSGQLGAVSPVQPAEYKHDDIGFVKIGTLFDTPEAIAHTESVLDEWVLAYGTDRFTSCGLTLDVDNRPIPLSHADMRTWKNDAIAAQKLRNRAGVPLWRAA